MNKRYENAIELAVDLGRGQINSEDILLRLLSTNPDLILDMVNSMPCMVDLTKTNKDPNIELDIVKAYNDGGIIQAIRLHRQLSGKSLVDSKHDVDNILAKCGVQRDGNTICADNSDYRHRTF